MREMLLWAYVWQATARFQAVDRVVTAVGGEEAGEGVISAAMAFVI